MKQITYWESLGDTGNAQIEIDVGHLTDYEREVLGRGLEFLLIKFKECKNLEDFQEMIKSFEESV